MPLVARFNPNIWRFYSFISLCDNKSTNHLCRRKSKLRICIRKSNDFLALVDAQRLWWVHCMEPRKFSISSFSTLKPLEMVVLPNLPKKSSETECISRQRRIEEKNCDHLPIFTFTCVYNTLLAKWNWTHQFPMRTHTLARLLSTHNKVSYNKWICLLGYRGHDIRMHYEKTTIFFVHSS